MIKFDGATSKIAFALSSDKGMFREPAAALSNKWENVNSVTPELGFAPSAPGMHA